MIRKEENANQHKISGWMENSRIIYPKWSFKTNAPKIKEIIFRGRLKLMWPNVMKDKENACIKCHAESTIHSRNPLENNLSGTTIQSEHSRQSIKWLSVSVQISAKVWYWLGNYYGIFQYQNFPVLSINVDNTLSSHLDVSWSISSLAWLGVSKSH